MFTLSVSPTRRFAFIVFVLVWMLLLSSIGFAATPAGAEIAVNTTTANVQRYPAVAMDANGNFVVAWESTGQDLGGYGTFFQRYDAAGTPLSVEAQANTLETDYDQDTPEVAMADNGRFVIVWESFNPNDGQGNDVYFHLYDADGSSILEAQANTVAANQQRKPAAAMDADGDFVVAWQDATDINARIFTAAGAESVAEFEVNTTLAGTQDFPAVDMDANGNFVVVWQSPDAGGNGIFAQRYNLAGVRQGGEFRVNVTEVGEQVNADVAMADDGTFVVVWQGPDAAGTGIYSRRFAANGTALDAADVRLNVTEAGDQNVPSVSWNNATQQVTTWQSADAAGKGVILNRIHWSGAANTGEIAVNTTTAGDQDFPAVAMNEAGNMAVTWQGPDADSTGIFAQRFALANPTSDLGTTALDFGNQAYNTSTAQTVSVTNNGTAQLDFTVIAITAGGTDYAILTGDVNDCAVGTGVAAGGGTCNIRVQFTPSGISTLNGTLEIQTNAPTSPQTVTLTGVGTQAATTTTITGAVPASPSAVGQAVTFSVDVSSTSGTPTGTVTITDGTLTCNATLTAGTGSCDLAFTTAGDKSITATYNGDTNFATSSTAAPTVHEVGGAATTTTLTGTNPVSPSTVGQAVTFSVSVTSGAGTPTGTVTVSDGTLTCNATLTAGVGSCDLAFTTAGLKSVTAAYNGDANFSSSVSTATDYTVNAADTTTTITNVSPSSPAVLGQAVTFNVSVISGAGTPTGTVTVSDGTLTCNAALSGGAGSCAIIFTTAGLKSVTAAYNGDSNFNTSISDITPYTVTESGVTLSTPSDFGSQNINTTSAAQTIILTNTGSATLTITSISMTTGATDFTIQANTCGTTLAPAGTCTIDVVFNPTTAGLKSGTLTVVSDAATSPNSVTLTGTGVEPTVTPSPTDEPTVTPSPTDEPTVTPSPTDEPTVTPSPTDEPTVTPSPTDEPTVTPSPTDEPTPTSWISAEAGQPIATFNASDGAEWYQIYIGAVPTFGVLDGVQQVYLNWNEKATTGQCDPLACVFTLSAYLPNGNYVAYYQTWNSASGLSQWTGPQYFAVGTEPPAIPTNLEVIGLNLVWTASERALWYQVYVGTPQGGRVYLQWHAASAICDANNRCTVSYKNMPVLLNQPYLWYVQAWGAGGYSVGGLEGWAEGPQFIP